MAGCVPVARELEGKVAIVSGASGGIGRETVLALAEAGASVVAADLPGSPVEQVADVAGAGGRVEPHMLNLADESSIEALVRFTLDRFGAVDILDNNAARLGLADDVDVVGQQASVWDGIFAVNTRGTMLMCKHVVPAMIDGGGGSIVNIGSATAGAGQLQATAYACTKAAVHTLTRYVATQYGDRGVRCNAIAPGIVGTETLRAALPQEMQDLLVENQLVPALCSPRNIADVVVFLASDRSAFITGEVIPVSGGMYAHVPTLAAERQAFAAARAER